MLERLVQDIAQTFLCAQWLAQRLRPGDCVAMIGPLGAGKTTFVRALVEALGGDPYQVHSPTFTIMNQYILAPPKTHLFHFDLYRIHNMDDLDSTGFFEHSRTLALTVVEWADQVAGIEEDLDWVVRISHTDADTQRYISISPTTIGTP